MIIENNLLRLIVEESKNYSSEKIEIKEDNSWIPLISSNDKCSTLTIWKGNKRQSKSLLFLKSKKKKLYYQLNDDDFLLNLDYYLEETNIIHISVCENYGHLGKDERVIGYIMFDWGVGSAATATAYMKKYFSDLYINFKEQLVFGINGILIKSFEFQEEVVDFELSLIQGKNYILIKCRDSPLKGSRIIINNSSIEKKGKMN